MKIRWFNRAAVGAVALSLVAVAVALASSGWQLASHPKVAESNYEELDATLATSSSEAWAAGFDRVRNGPFRALIEHFNGGAWTIGSSAPIAGSDDTRFHALAATSPSNAWVVGSDTTSAGVGHGLIEHWNGSVWTRNPTAANEPATSTLVGVSADSPNDAWAVGYARPTSAFEPLIEHYNGSGWTAVAGAASYPGGANNRLLTVAALSPSDVWALGVTGRHPDPVFEHWNGSSWSIVPQPASGYDVFLSGISAVGPSDIWAVGGQKVTETLTEHWNGSAWSIVPSPNVAPKVEGEAINSTLSAVSALGPSDVWAVGHSINFTAGSVESTLTEHWNGSAWSIAASPGNAPLSSVSGLPGGPLFAVGGPLILSH
jgi:hypothetical protein